MNSNVHPLVCRLVVGLVGRSICPNCLKHFVTLCLSEHLFYQGLTYPRRSKAFLEYIPVASVLIALKLNLFQHFLRRGKVRPSASGSTRQ